MNLLANDRGLRVASRAARLTRRTRNAVVPRRLSRCWPLAEPLSLFALEVAPPAPVVDAAIEHDAERWDGLG